jgi:hypothetical protein
MKIQIKLILFAFFISAAYSLYSQTWVNNYDFSGGYSGYDITQIQFINPNTGWITMQNNNTVVILKTVNKGKDWTQINTYNVYLSISKTFFIFLNEQTGYRAHSPSGSIYTILDKTTDGGYSWVTKINLISIQGKQPVIFFKNSTEGYLFIIEKYNPWQVQVWRTYDGFETYTESYYYDHPDQVFFQLNDVILGSNSNMVGIGNDENIQSGMKSFYRILGDGGNFLNSYGTNFTLLHYLYGAYINSNLRYLGVEADNSSSYPGTRFYTNLNQGENSILIDENTNYLKVGGLSFSDDSKGFTTVDNKIYITANSGNNWTQEATLNSSNVSDNGHRRIKSFGDVCYTASSGGKFYTRLISENLNTNFDWQGGVYNMNVDDINYETPISSYLRGGTLLLSVNPFITKVVNNIIDTTAMFYYWGGDCNGSMYSSSSYYTIYPGKNINADYKTNLVTNNLNAFKNEGQYQVLNDANGVKNVIYESMEGIFYTRTKHSNGHYKCEEILSCSGYKTWGNTNPSITEIFPLNAGDIINSESNIAAMYEQRVGNTINIYNRTRLGDASGYISWNGGYMSHTITNAPQNFQAHAKQFIAKHPIDQNNENYFLSNTLLRPVQGGYNEIAIVAKANTNGEKNLDFSVDAGNSNGNITNYEVACNYISYIERAFDFYFTYEKGGKIWFRHIKVTNDGSYGLHATDNGEGFKNLSELDALQDRGEVDISLRNSSTNSGTTILQPVITYKARYNVKIAINEHDAASIGSSAEPTFVNVTRYPIVYRERLSNGQWASQNGWYDDADYKNNPGIEGSKLFNSYLINYMKNSSVMVQKVTKWKGSYNSRFIDSYIGNDAKFVRNSLYNESSINPSINLLTLSSGSSPYSINTSNYTIRTTANENDPYPDQVNGVLVSGDCQYSFNLGSIMVNGQLINFYPDADSLIDSVEQLNDNMKSKTFGLNENDTLIIGRNCFYLEQDEQNPFTEVQYSVVLMNKTTESPHMILLQDTLQARDSIQIEYLDGFVINNIPLGFDSFYVQMRIDTLRDGGGDAAGVRFGMNLIQGGFGIGESGGDNPLGNRYINWHNKMTNNNNNLPTVYNLYQNYPNPFNPVTTIKYDIPKNSNVTLIVYDLLGREVTRLVNNEMKNAGRYEIKWPAPSGNANNFASGVYIYRIQAGDYVSVKKMVFLK